MLVIAVGLLCCDVVRERWVLKDDMPPVVEVRVMMLMITKDANEDDDDYHDRSARTEGMDGSKNEYAEITYADATLIAQKVLLQSLPRHLNTLSTFNTPRSHFLSMMARCHQSKQSAPIPTTAKASNTPVSTPILFDRPPALTGATDCVC